MKFFILVILVAAVSATSSLKMPFFFGDNMVVQRAPIGFSVWGWANPGVMVTVHFNSISQMTTTPASGKWVINQNLEFASGGPYTLTITSTDGGSVSYQNVLVGDVYFCSGQSNMELTVIDAFNSTAEIADSINYPNLRVFSVQKVPSLTPLDDVTSKAPYKWGISSPSVIGGPTWEYFSATCYFFGRNIYKQFDGALPIGLVHSSWGGTIIEAWSTPDALEQCNTSFVPPLPFPNPDPATGLPDPHVPLSLPPHHSSVAAKVMSTPTPSYTQNAAAAPSPNTPSVLFNGMVHPLLNLRFVGMIWYQGESNSNHPVEYACRLPAMVNDYRQKFGLKFGFYFMQIAPWMKMDGANGQFPALRWAQSMAFPTDPWSFYAVSIDLGDPEDSQLNSIHPRNKQEVGRRLALPVLASLYGVEVPYAPVLSNVVATRRNDSLWIYTISFAVQTSGGQIEMVGTEWCELCCASTPFQVQSSLTGKWLLAPVLQVASNTITILAPMTEQPSGVVYAWNDFPECVVTDTASKLPASPFFSAQ